MPKKAEQKPLSEHLAQLERKHQDIAMQILHVRRQMEPDEEAKQTTTPTKGSAAQRARERSQKKQNRDHEMK